MEFQIKYPLWARVIGWIMTAIGFIVITVTPIFYFVVPIEYVIFVAIEAVGAAIAAGGLLIDYIVIMEKFELRGGIFRYRKPFKKSQSAPVQDIDKVEVHGSYAVLPIVDIVFYSKDGHKLIHFYDDGMAFTGGKFMKALQELHIPIFYR